MKNDKQYRIRLNKQIQNKKDQTEMEQASGQQLCISVYCGKEKW